MYTIKEIKDMLYVKKTDFFISYGLGETSRKLIEDLLQFTEVSTAIAFNGYRDQKPIKTKIYETYKELPGHGIFDKILCIIPELPASERDHLDTTINRCLTICSDNGMVLFLGLKDRSYAMSLIIKNNIKKESIWYIGQNDLLVKKEKY